MMVIVNVSFASFCRLIIPRFGGGSKKGRKMIVRNFALAMTTLWDHYFCQVPLYSNLIFRRRFRVSRQIFERVYHACLTHPCFQYNPNAAGKFGIHPLVKITAIFR